MACFQHTFTGCPEGCNSQSIRTYSTAQAMKKGCLKTTLPTELAILLITQQTHTGMQGTKLLTPAGSALRWTARQHDSAPDSYQVQLTDHSSWQCVEYEENDITTMKTKQLRKRTKDLTSSEKMSEPLLYPHPNKRCQKSKQSLPT